MGYLFLSDQYSYNDQTFVWAHSLRLSSQTQPFIADSITIISNYLSSEILSSIENVLGKHIGEKKKKKAHLLKLQFGTSIIVCIIKDVIWSQNTTSKSIKTWYSFFLSFNKLCFLFPFSFPTQVSWNSTEHVLCAHLLLAHCQYLFIFWRKGLHSKMRQISPRLL